MDTTAVVLREALGITQLEGEIRRLREAIEAQHPSASPAWLTLRAACALKGVSYNTVKSKRDLQPSHGQSDATIGGRRVWKRATVEAWLGEVDG